MKTHRFFAVLTLLVLAACVCVLWPAHLSAQSPSAYPYTKLIPNDPTTGTVQFTLTCLNSSGNAVECAGAATHGYSGVCVGNCGKSGSAWVAFAGIVPLIVDGSTTLQHYIQFGSTSGEGHDTGATTYPTSGGDVIGAVKTASTGAASVSMIDLFPPEIQAGGSSGSTPVPVWVEQGGGQSTSLIAFAANTIKVAAMYVATPITFSNLVYSVNVADNTADAYDVGIYGPCNGGNASCPLVARLSNGTSGIAGTTFAPTAVQSGKTIAFNGGPITISTPGRYYWAYTCNTGCTASLYGMTTAGVYWILPNTSSSTASTGGALPSTIATPTDSWAGAGVPQFALF